MSLCTLTHDFFITIACKSSKSVFVFLVNGSFKVSQNWAFCILMSTLKSFLITFLMKLIYSGGFSVNVIPAIFHKKYTKLLHLFNYFIFLLTSSSPLIRPRPFKRIKSSLAFHFSLVDYPVSHGTAYYSNKQGCNLLIHVDFKHTS